MTERIYVRPGECRVEGAERLLVRRDDSPAYVPEEGAWMQRSPYVERCLRDGDLVACEPPPDPDSQPPKRGASKPSRAAED